MKLMFIVSLYLLTSSVFADAGKEFRLQLERQHLATWYYVDVTLKDEADASPILNVYWAPSGVKLGTCKLKFKNRTRSEWQFVNDQSCDLSFMNKGDTQPVVNFTYYAFELGDALYDKGTQAQLKLGFRSKINGNVFWAKTEQALWTCWVTAGNENSGTKSCKNGDEKHWEKFGVMVP